MWNELSAKMVEKRDGGELAAIIAKVDVTENPYLGGKSSRGPCLSKATRH